MKNKKQLYGVLFAAPVIIGLLVLFVWPMIQSLQIAFSDVTPSSGGLKLEWAGFKNFNAVFFVDNEYIPKLNWVLPQMLMNVPIVVMFSFIAANIINQKFHGQKVARVIFFLPIVLASTAMIAMDTSDMMQQAMTNPDFKDIATSQSFLQSFELSGMMMSLGFPPEIVQFLSTAVNQVYQVITLSGVQMLIILAALQSVSPSLYEAAHVEGATGWEKFWLVTFPLISPTLLLCVIYSIIDSFTAWDNGIVTLINNKYAATQYAMSSAMAWVYFVIIGAILGIVIFAGSKLVFNYDK